MDTLGGEGKSMETRTVTQRTAAVDSLTKIQRLPGLIEARAILDREIADIESMFGGSVSYQPTTTQSPAVPLPDGVTRITFGGPAPAEPVQIAPVSVPRKKRKLTVEARQKIADAQKKRWAAVKRAKSAK